MAAATIWRSRLQMRLDENFNPAMRQEQESEGESRLSECCERIADRLLAIGKDCAVHLKEPFRSAAHGYLVYDERGLPR